MSDIVHLFPCLSVASDCTGCGESHSEIGELCATCRVKQGPVDVSIIHAEIAQAIHDLRRSQNQGAPLAGHVADALVRMRRLYDATEPMITISGRGYVELVGGELWAFPEAGVSIGPFGNEERAQDAITKWAEANEARKAVT